MKSKRGDLSADAWIAEMHRRRGARRAVLCALAAAVLAVAIYAVYVRVRTFSFADVMKARGISMGMAVQRIQVHPTAKREDGMHDVDDARKHEIHKKLRSCIQDLRYADIEYGYHPTREEEEPAVTFILQYHDGTRVQIDVGRGYVLIFGKPAVIASFDRFEEVLALYGEAWGTGDSARG